MGATYVATTPRAVLTWRPATDLMTYASYSEGFRSGLLQSPPIYAQYPQFPSAKPDKLYNYEIGAKGDFWERRLSFDAAVYYMKWKGIQQSLSVVVDGLCCDTVNVNAGTASGMGTDLTVTLRPIDHKFGAKFSWNNLRNSKVRCSPTASSCTRKGIVPPCPPEYTAGGSAAYTISFGATGYGAKLEASLNYISTLINHNVTGTPAVLVSSTGNSTDHGTCGNFAQRTTHWSVTAFVDNLTNASGSQDRSYEYLGYADWDVRVRPRTVGVQFDYSLR